MIIRTYRCDDCGDTFEVTCESADGDPPCPFCERVLHWQPERFAIGTNRGRALDLTQDIVEQDYKLTNLKDNLREGDVAAMTPPPSREERDLQARITEENRQLMNDASLGKMSPQAKEFFSGAGGVRQVNVAAAALADAKSNRAENARAMDMFVAGGRKGHHALTYRLLTDQGRTLTVRK